jgi:acyl-CoA thioester hydrolase
MFTKQLTVRFNECDGLGHVNNGNYFMYMEDARTDIFRICHPSLDVHSWNLIVAGTRCDFLQQVAFSEELTVQTWISKLGNSSFVVDHALQNNQGDYVARGQATLIFYDYAHKRATPIPEEVRLAFASHPEGPPGAPSLRS